MPPESEKRLATVLTYEIGMLNIGRVVKVFKTESRRQHGMAARLLGGTPKRAMVQITGHRERVDRVRWDHVFDWRSHNAEPLVMPEVERVG